MELGRNKPSVKCGNSYSLVKTAAGLVYSFGTNSKGALGFGLKKLDVTKNKPTLLPLRNIVQIDSFFYTSFFLDNKGHVYACGQNNESETGIFGENFGSPGEEFHKNQPKSPITCVGVPTIVEGLKSNKIVYVCTGDYITFFIDDRNHVFGCGRNRDGALGMGHTNKVRVPTFIKKLSNEIRVKMIDVGQYHSIVLSEDGVCYGAGKNSIGQIGFADGKKRSTHQKIKFPKIKFSKNDQRIKNPPSGFGFLVTPTPRKVNEKFIKVSTGWDHSLFLSSKGRVYGCGQNSAGQLGSGSESFNSQSNYRYKGGNQKTPRFFKSLENEFITNIFGEGGYSFFLTSTRKIFGCGSNIGQFSDKSGKYSNTFPTEITLFQTCGIKSFPIFISGACTHAIFLMDDLKAYAVGSKNSSYMGKFDDKKVPKKSWELGNGYRGLNLIDVELDDFLFVQVINRNCYLDLIIFCQS